MIKKSSSNNFYREMVDGGNHYVIRAKGAFEYINFKSRTYVKKGGTAEEIPSLYGMVFFCYLFRKQ